MRIDVNQAIRLLLDGHVVALPTETVYGLAASVAFPQAVEKIFSLKGRPSDNPLIMHVASSDQLSPYITGFPPYFTELTRVFWPGPLTLVLEANQEKVPTAVRAGLPTIAVRIPDHAVTQQVLAETGPLVMPSANISGRPSATTAEHVNDDFGLALPILDGGPCLQGVESTILIYRGQEWVIGRQGAISAEQIAKVIGKIPLPAVKHAQPLCPGQHYRHYAPQAVLKPFRGREGEVVVGFSDRNYPRAEKVYHLGNSFEPAHVAANMYRILRRLDQDHVPEACIDWDFPEQGLWRTIRERLRKASDLN